LNARACHRFIKRLTRKDFKELRRLHPHSVLLDLLEENHDEPRFRAETFPLMYGYQGLAYTSVLRDTFSAVVKSSRLEHSKLKDWLQDMSQSSGRGLLGKTIAPRILDWDPPLWSIPSYAELVQQSKLTGNDDQKKTQDEYFPPYRT
jgi:hypothetical protein